MHGQQLYTSQEIARHLKCEPRDVHDAIQNQPKDNLDEDMMYLRDLLGTAMDVDRAQSSKASAELAEPSEATAVDEKPDAKELLRGDDHEDDGQDERDEMEIENCASQAVFSVDLFADNIHACIRHRSNGRF